MGVWIAGAHHGPAVLKYLHVLDEVLAAKFLILLGPCIDNRANLLSGHAGQSERVVGVVAENLADAPGRLGHQQRRDFLVSGGSG